MLGVFHSIPNMPGDSFSMNFLVVLVFNLLFWRMNQQWGTFGVGTNPVRSDRGWRGWVLTAFDPLTQIDRI